jgi:hypothetical protein
MRRQLCDDHPDGAACRRRGGVVLCRPSCGFVAIAAAALCGAVLLAGCQTQQQSSKRTAGNGPYIDTTDGGVPYNPGKQQSSASKKTPPLSVGQMEPCAARLQDVEGAMLMYWAVNRHLPEKLDELKEFADVGTELNFTCPASGLPYVYAPGGLQSAGRPKRIIMHDATPAHDGKRWCILMAPIKPGQAPYMEVLQMPDALFRTYLPISEQNP